MKVSDYYRGKSVLITGGSSGIGFAIAKALVQMDAHIILLARDYENLKIAKTAILEKYPKAKVKIVPVDVTDETTLDVLYGKYMRNHALPDILINCAGVARPGYVQELPAEVFRWTMDIDYHGTVNTVKLLLPGMIERGSGHIINVSSIAGVIGIFGYTAYCGAKFAVKGFSDALRSEMKPKGIRVSVLYPPDTDTPQLASENQYKPEETRAISGAAKPISPDWVAQYTLKAAAHGKYAIVPGFEAKIMYFAGTSLGNWIYPIMDFLVRSASKKK
ncbi:MAG: SDR family oxidoreductase [Anaerolineaceae bacterium]|jgi:3-dehydrosphinganine reductase|nr:SDR family oxidoreductase [Anaerolineaceae bacterium]MDD4042066.1 SDR family oxidoreductase [Anaerolineaceae bacterium]MDD4578687.1 SDR family oxidoreductase [Anaerolineaceae bacterium]